MSRNAPLTEQDDELSIAVDAPPAPARARPTRRVQERRWDVIAVGILTPTLLASTVVGVFLLGQVFYPDPNPPNLVFPTATASARAVARPTPMVAVAAQPVDTTKLNAGIIDRPPPFEWPEVDDLKLVVNPGRPNEQADYTPKVGSVEVRRQIEAISVSIVQHSSPSLAQAAAAELAKAYPATGEKPRVLDLTAQSGYLADESAFAVVTTYGTYRIHVEAIAASPPFKPGQKPEIEYLTLHLADHIARRVQEVSSGGRRTGPEATAVHWRDHITRSLPFGR
jgi:hypothetical protein